MSAASDQQGLAIVGSPKITITPGGAIYLGAPITLGVWVTSSAPGQVPCLVEFYLQQGNASQCLPVQIPPNIAQVANPTHPITLNSGAPAQYFSFQWAVQGVAGPAEFYAQARDVNLPPGLPPPCTTDLWNAKRGCEFLRAGAPMPAPFPEDPVPCFYEAFAVINQEGEHVHSRFSATAVSPGEPLHEPAVRAEIDRLRKEGFIFSMPNRLTSFLGKERALRPEGAKRAWLNRAGAIAQGEFQELKDGDPLDEAFRLPLIPGEARQVLLELSRSRDVETREFYVVRVRTEVKDQVWERLRIFRSHDGLPAAISER